jgi:hypothetical protein
MYYLNLYSQKELKLHNRGKLKLVLINLIIIGQVQILINSGDRYPTFGDYRFLATFSITLRILIIIEIVNFTRYN